MMTVTDEPQPARPDLTAIRSRLKAASEGFWCSSGHGDILCGVGSEYQRLGQMESDWYGQWRRNAEFIIYAHQDIPALLAYVERLEAAGRQLEAALMAWTGRWPEHADTADAEALAAWRAAKGEE